MLSQWFRRAPKDTDFATLAALQDALSQTGVGEASYDLKLQ